MTCVSYNAHHTHIDKSPVPAHVSVQLCFGKNPVFLSPYCVMHTPDDIAHGALAAISVCVIAAKHTSISLHTIQTVCALYVGEVSIVCGVACQIVCFCCCDTC